MTRTRDVPVIESVEEGDYLTGEQHRDGKVRYHRTRQGEVVHYTALGPDYDGTVSVADDGMAHPLIRTHQPVTKESSEVDRAREALRRNLISIKKQADILLAELESGS
jgi:hypothetical protein